MKNTEVPNFIEEKDEKNRGWRGTLRVLRAETWLTVYRTIAIPVQWVSWDLFGTFQVRLAASPGFFSTYLFDKQCLLSGSKPKPGGFRNS